MPLARSLLVLAPPYSPARSETGGMIDGRRLDGGGHFKGQLLALERAGLVSRGFVRGWAGGRANRT